MSSDQSFEMTVASAARPKSGDVGGIVSAPVIRASKPVPSLFSHLEVPFVHKWLILTCLLASLGLAWLTILVWPRTYESEGQIMIRVGRESVSLDPTATTGTQTLLIQKTRNEEVISALGVLSSRQVYEGVVDKLGAENIINGEFPGEASDEPKNEFVELLLNAKSAAQNLAGSMLVATGLRDELSDREEAVMVLQKSVDIYAPRESAVLSINSKAKSPEMAQTVSQTIIDTFIDQHMSISRQPGSYDFFARQATEQQAELDKLIARRTTYMTENGLISIGSNQTILQEQLTATSKQLLDAEGQLNQTMAQIEEAMDTRDLLPTEILAGKQQKENSTYSGMRQKLFDLEVRERRYAETLTADNPKLLIVRKQIAQINRILGDIDREQVETSTTVNPAMQRVESDIQTLAMNAAGLKSMIAEKKAQCERITESINKLSEHDQDLRTLDREIALKESSLNSLRVKLEESRVIDEMGRDRISNVSVFQPASLIERPTSPKKQPLAALFIALGLASGLVFAYVREANLTTLRSAQHVATSTGAEPIYTVERNWRLKNSRRTRKLPKDLDKTCKSLLSDLLLTQNWGEQRAVGVLGVEPGCGASSIAASLSIVSSEECGLETTLVDADGEGRTVSKAFRLARSPGLAELAKGTADLDECVQKKDKKLSLIPFSAPTANLNRLNGNFDAVVASLTEVRGQTDVVIVDLPPASESPESIALARELDHVVVVFESEKTTSEQAAKILRYLDAGHTNIVGVVLNKTKRHTPRWFSYFTPDGSNS